MTLGEISNIKNRQLGTGRLIHPPFKCRTLPHQTNITVYVLLKKYKNHFVYLEIYIHPLYAVVFYITRNKQYLLFYFNIKSFLAPSVQFV